MDESGLEIKLFGIRHHGPGCSRALLRALQEFSPEVIALEMPADVGTALEWIQDPELVPPVALLIFPPSDPRRGVFYPLASFSPEWQCLRFAWLHNIPIEPIDLPVGLRLGYEDRISETQSTVDDETGLAPNTVPWDPIGNLAAAAGYSDGEQWWEEQIERCVDTSELFESIHEAMTALRSSRQHFLRELDAVREAHMRRSLRQLISQGVSRIAVVCGALHTPALTLDALQGRVPQCRKSEDSARLSGIKRVKVEATWVPYSHERLTLSSGYGAGIQSPGWYLHLWENEGSKSAAYWIARAARLMRDSGLDTSSAGVIEAVRLADALAAMRRRHVVGLPELTDAIQTVLCQGDTAPLQLIHRRLEVGTKLGRIPENAPTVPLAKDLASLQKRLRLKPSPEAKLIDLDLRSEIGLARSHLLHRLKILDIPWGTVDEEPMGKGTFRERWNVQWQPEFEIRIILAAMWGHTVHEASAAQAIASGEEAQELLALASLIRQTQLADLSHAMGPLLQRLDTLAAVAAEVRQLLSALSPLARVARYSDVRGTRANEVVPILVTMFYRGITGLMRACSGLDDEASEVMVDAISGVSSAIRILERDDLLTAWYETLERLVDSNCAPMIRGWACRELMSAERISQERLEQIVGQALSRANDSIEAASWTQGLLRGSGSLLLHQPLIWAVLDEWLTRLDGDAFVVQLPLLRRAFSDFNRSQRRQITNQVLQLRSLSSRPATIANDHAAPTSSNQASDMQEDAEWDTARASLVVPILLEMLKPRS